MKNNLAKYVTDMHFTAFVFDLERMLLEYLLSSKTSFAVLKQIIQVL